MFRNIFKFNEMKFLSLKIKFKKKQPHGMVFLTKNISTLQHTSILRMLLVELKRGHFIFK